MTHATQCTCGAGLGGGGGRAHGKVSSRASVIGRLPAPLRCRHPASGALLGCRRARMPATPRGCTRCHTASATHPPTAHRVVAQAALLAAAAGAPVQVGEVDGQLALAWVAGHHLLEEACGAGGRPCCSGAPGGGATARGGHNTNLAEKQSANKPTHPPTHPPSAPPHQPNAFLPTPARPSRSPAPGPR